MRKLDAKMGIAKMPDIVGYCRVSTDGQTLDAQIAALKAAGATRMFAEKQSGARSDRPQLRKALDALGEGDTLIVTRLDRLARSTRDLLNTLHSISTRSRQDRPITTGDGDSDWGGLLGSTNEIFNGS
jgi:predicted site-specific integrase-resolvase